MKPLSLDQQEMAETLAFGLADVLMKQFPSLFTEPPEVVVGVTLPITQALVRAEAKAVRYKRDAKRWRAMGKQARRTAADPGPAPAQPVPVDAERGV